ncbi:hypothetical protein [Streptomyces azureus]|uniref:hypothetical protein n=1 Tax=Streptomyces azureus TaxID=146537 RepID=UPI003C2B0C70
MSLAALSCRVVRDPDTVEAMAQLVNETETMHAHGWARAAQPEPPACPLAPPGLTSRGRG